VIKNIFFYILFLEFYLFTISYLLSGGEFGWGGTFAILQRKCPKGSSDGTEIPL